MPPSRVGCASRASISYRAKSWPSSTDLRQRLSPLKFGNATFLPAIPDGAGAGVGLRTVGELAVEARPRETLLARLSSAPTEASARFRGGVAPFTVGDLCVASHLYGHMRYDFGAPSAGRCCHQYFHNGHRRLVAWRC